MANAAEQNCTKYVERAIIYPIKIHLPVQKCTCYRQVIYIQTVTYHYWKKMNIPFTIDKKYILQRSILKFSVPLEKQGYKTMCIWWTYYNDLCMEM